MQLVGPWLLTGQLEHDDDERDGHPGDAAENCRGSDHRVQARSDARVALVALAL